MTLAPLLFALVLHAPVDSVHVRGVARDTTLAVMPTAAGGALRADVVLPLIGGSVTRRGSRPVVDRRAGGQLHARGRRPVRAAASDGLIPLATAPDRAQRRAPGAAADSRRRRSAHREPHRVGRPEPRAARVPEPREVRELRAAVAAGEPRASRPAPGGLASTVIRADATTGAANAAASPARTAKRRLVVVDAGHGGPDNGMHGPIGQRTTLYEKDITLAVAKKLARELESRGVDVLMTRTTDTLIALGDRGKIANRANGDLFISIHVNAANPNWKDPGGRARLRDVLPRRGEDRGRAPRREDGERGRALREQRRRRRQDDRARASSSRTWRRTSSCASRATSRRSIQHRLARSHPGRAAA